MGQLLNHSEAMATLSGEATVMRLRLQLLRAHAQGRADEATDLSRAMLLLNRLRAGKQRWEPVFERLCDPVEATVFRREAAELNSHHDLLAAALPKWGFQHSLGL